RRETVDFPHPDSPTRARVSRSASEKLTPSTARTAPPKTFLRSVTSSSLFIGRAPCPAGDALTGRHVYKFGNENRTFRPPLWAARMERATRWHFGNMRHGATDGRQAMLQFH